MITVVLRGGLGNQLFQYATGWALSETWNLPLCLDTKWFEDVLEMKGAAPRAYALAPFCLGASIQHVGLSAAYSSHLWRFLRPLSGVLMRLTHAPYIVQESSFRFVADAFGEKRPVWLDGYWQSWRYFESISDRLREKLAFPRRLSRKSTDILERIRSSSCAVCLHVRRGDYVTDRSTASFHGTCSAAYYENAMRSMHFDSDPVCFVFSDDMAWARANLHLPCSVVWVDGNGPDEAHQDLWLMAACRHFVIANSSLSWWGAWLGTAVDKQVVAPRRWFASGSRDTSDLLPQEWIQM